VPPNLDLPYSSRPPATNSRPEKMLELFLGVACILDPEGVVTAVSDNWDDLMSRASDAELLRNVVLGKAFLNMLPGDDELRTSLCFALASLAEENRSTSFRPQTMGCQPDRS